MSMIKRAFIHTGAKSGAVAKAEASGGFTLIEILVTMFILAIGLLGLAGLVMEGMKNNQGAYLRTQASILAYDMADRIRTNRQYAEAGGVYQEFSTDDASTALPDCATADTGCSPAQQAAVDLVQWTRQIEGTGSGITLLPGGRGAINFDSGSSIYTITVEWEKVAREGESQNDTVENSYAVRFAL